MAYRRLGCSSTTSSEARTEKRDLQKYFHKKNGDVITSVIMTVSITTVSMTQIYLPIVSEKDLHAWQGEHSETKSCFQQGEKKNRPPINNAQMNDQSK